MTSDILLGLSIAYLIFGLAVYTRILILPFEFVARFAIATAQLHRDRSNNPADRDR
jgi:hypothetical protein